MALRVLTLHGFGQNANVFMEKRAKEISRKLRAVLTLHAIDAPHELPYDCSLRGWWTYPEELWDGRGETIQALAEDLLQRPDCEFEAVGLRKSFDLVLAEWSRGGYDGILGFSQGAILAAALCAELHRQGGAVPCPRFAILISGFGKPVPKGLDAYPPKEPLRIPSLHIWGEADDHIPGWASEALAVHFVEPRTYVHTGHHYVPQKAADVAVFQEFLSPFLPGVVAATPARSLAQGLPRDSVPTVVQAAPARPEIDSGEDVHALKQADEADMAPRSRPLRAPPGSDELASALRGYGILPARCNGDHLPRCSPVPLPLDAVILREGSYLEEELEFPGVATHERLLQLLQKEKVDFLTLGPHPACRTSEDAVRVRLEGGWQGVTLHSGAKAMLLYAPNSKWVLAVLPADRKLSWKKIRALHGKATRMATEEEVRDVAGCVPGAVPPFAAAFPVAAECLVDSSLPSVINFNCGLRTRSMRLSRADFERIQNPSFAEITE